MEMSSGNDLELLNASTFTRSRPLGTYWSLFHVKHRFRPQTIARIPIDHLDDLRQLTGPNWKAVLFHVKHKHTTSAAGAGWCTLSLSALGVRAETQGGQR